MIKEKENNSNSTTINVLMKERRLEWIEAQLNIFPVTDTIYFGHIFLLLLSE